ncbi:MAG: CoA transferase [Candidatus Odyssella sp.]|nr:CoA transferase [Candidatus Odyssella sp.]
MNGSLSDILVVAIDQAVAAPYCTSRLADAGARVIKVERPGGDFARHYDTVAGGLSAYFVWLNRGKESIVLDVKRPDDAALLRRMLAKADVFVQNLIPGAAARLGFGGDELRATNPGLVACDISGYGEDGPYAEMKSYDLLIQAETGLASITGRPEGPGRVGVSVVDVAAGMYAYMGILEALLERARTGRGKTIKVSLFDAMADWMTVPLLYQEHTGKAPPRVGLAHPSVQPYGLYDCADGQIVISVQNDREWERFCRRVLGRDALVDDPRFNHMPGRVANLPALNAIIAPIFAALPRETLAAKLRAADIAYGALNTVADLAKHPQLRRVAQPTERGELALVASPIRRGPTPARYKPIPALDEHGAALRAEFAAPAGGGAGNR